MIYFVTGFTGALVPVIVEEVLRKDPDAFFYFGLRPGDAGITVPDRFGAVVASLELSEPERELLRVRSRVIRVEAGRERLGIAPPLWGELVDRVDRVLHGAADVRFNRSYAESRVSNVLFTEQIYALYAAIRDRRAGTDASAPTLYYLSTAYAYGDYPAPIPEQYPEFHPRRPENNYVRTKAEAKRFLLDKIRHLGDQIVIFEPTIVGGSATTGRTRSYHLHYLVIMLGYLGRLPFLAAEDNTLDIVPVDWVAAVVADVITGGTFRQGILRLASGPDAIRIGTLYETALAYYRAHDPRRGHRIPDIRFVPGWYLAAMVGLARRYYQGLHTVTAHARYRRRLRQVELLQSYLPYMLKRKVFDNSRSTALIRSHTGRGPAPRLQDIVDADGRLVEPGYYDRILADTLRTGWGGLIKHGD